MKKKKQQKPYTGLITLRKHFDHTLRLFLHYKLDQVSKKTMEELDQTPVIEFLDWAKAKVQSLEEKAKQ